MFSFVAPEGDSGAKIMIAVDFQGKTGLTRGECHPGRGSRNSKTGLTLFMDDPCFREQILVLRKITSGSWF